LGNSEKISTTKEIRPRNSNKKWPGKRIKKKTHETYYAIAETKKKNRKGERRKTLAAIAAWSINNLGLH